MGGNKTVLVIDDDPGISGFLGDFLRLEGYEVLSAGNGAEGLAALQQCVPDLILLDMQMPVMDGPSFAHECRARYDSTIPIVVITAHRGAAASSHEFGANDYILKPFDLVHLLDVVHRYI